MAKKKKEDARYAHNPEYTMILPNEEDVAGTGES